VSKRVLRPSCRILNLLAAVLISGFVALVLNLLLPQDESQRNDDEECVEVVQDLEIQMSDQERKS
jgi:hypothetical protein